MKKLILIVLLIFSLTATSLPAIYAETGVVERPDIKININGAISSYSRIPIIIGGRTLLPLREVLVNLGVPNDDQHIIWDSNEKSITVINGSIKLYLKINDKNALVNDVPIIIDVAPVIYKNSTYIPVRFISQSLGLKVAWDTPSSMVLIRDPESYSKTEEVLKKSVDAMSAADKYKTQETAHLTITQGNNNFTFDTQINAITDAKKKLGSASINRTQTVLGKTSKMDLDICAANSLIYLKNPITGAWIKQKTGDSNYSDLYRYNSTQPTEVACSGLIKEDGTGQGDIVLKGKVNINDYLHEYMDFEELTPYTVTDCYAEINIDRSSYLVKRIYIKVSGRTTSIKGGAQYSLELTETNLDFNGDYDVTLPSNLPA
ncbi:MAG: copper amine oxidase N-terminal domain-containing protein [Bacillota bacterium]|nr:copper amine oxidase N-terminal domain-containing protein [Bacillota bacterium]